MDFQKMGNQSPLEGRRTILLTRATGYVGGRLLAELEAKGHRVRCLARRPEFLAGRVGAATEVVSGDCLEPETLGAALAGVDTAFYLVHSMGSAGDFEEQDRAAATNFGRASRDAGASRIVYLGGLGNQSDALSRHLQSRQETGKCLRESEVPVIELRASIILGSGSLSFDLIRALVERLPVMICPRWVRAQAQPIAIEDVVAYLEASLDLPAESRVFEIGGAVMVSYESIMREHARQRGLRRFMTFVPILTPRLSSLWLGLTTPVYAWVGRKLIESIRNSTVVTDAAALTAFAVRPMGLRKAIERAIRNDDNEFAATRRSDATSSGASSRTWGGNQVRLASGRFAHSLRAGCAQRGVRSDAADRRRARLVVRERAVAVAGLPGFFWSEASACVGAACIRTNPGLETRWVSGGSRPTSRIEGSVSPRR